MASSTSSWNPKAGDGAPGDHEAIARACNRETAARRSALHSERPNQVVADIGVIRFQPHGFLEFADCLVGVGFQAKGEAEVALRAAIVFRDFQRMPKQDLIVLRMSELFPCRRGAEGNRC